jgi:arginine-tRNA-protein transferase
MESRLMLDVEPAEFERILVRGWRRFGPTYFRPACVSCRECVSIRVPVATFEPTKSQRRARRKCAHIRLRVGCPSVDEERLGLYHAWHAQREERRGWPGDTVDEERYFLQFGFPDPCAREFAYYDGPRLVAIGLCDETPAALSSVYFFFHPDYARHSLGTASVLFEVEHARQRGIPHLYLGYRVLGCPSLRYKADYGPHELLRGWPAQDEEPRWERPG